MSDDNAIDSQHAPAKLKPAVTATAKEQPEPDSPKTAPAPSKSTHVQSSGTESAIHVKWYVDALADGRLFHGFIKSISTQGTDVYFDVNLNKVKSLKLRIHVPPASKTSPPHFIEVSGKVVYTSYNSEESLFHASVHFLDFTQESDRQDLQSRIAAFNKPR